MEIERRFSATGATLEPNSRRTITGYAAVFNSPSEEMQLSNRGTFREVIKPGAFTESIRTKADVLAKFEHAGILGRVGNGTLRLTENHRGLHYEIDAPDTTLGDDVVELIRRRDVAFSSFAFTVRPGGDAWRREGGTMIREIRSAKLLDVSPVSKPAYQATEVALRSLEAWEANCGDTRRLRLELAQRI